MAEKSEVAFAVRAAIACCDAKRDEVAPPQYQVNHLTQMFGLLSKQDKARVVRCVIHHYGAPVGSLGWRTSFVVGYLMGDTCGDAAAIVRAVQLGLRVRDWARGQG